AVPRRSCDIRGCRSSSVLGRCAGGEPPGVVLQPATLTAPASRAAPSARRDDGEDMLTIASLQKTFEVAGAQIPALRGVDLEISRGEFFVLLGPSGCGKTTMLRCVAGLERPDAGSITIDGSVVFSARERVAVAPERRPIGMVFQSYAVWPHMDVYENV